ncbi:MAG: Lipopolysaccharide core heptosyltransferase RfaQ [Elusimicrobia bacterium]|nr:Lipopolysaccharide core heptosyltransferase RfaQ [Elusimicrobiota bacterium]
MKILLIQLRRIGDILLTGPTAVYLRNIFPESEIHILTEPAGIPVMETNPSIDRVMIYDKNHPWRMIRMIRSGKYDVVFDFMNNPRTGLLTLLSGARWKVGWSHPVRKIFYQCAVPIPDYPEYVPLRKIRMVRAWLAKIGKPNPEPQMLLPQIKTTAEDELFADQWMAKEALKPLQFVVMAPASRYAVRSWRKEGYRKVALSLMKDFGKRVFIAWGPGEEDFVEEIRKGEGEAIGKLPQTSLREMAAIFARASLVLTVDCGSMHTAVSMGTPTVTLYGPTRPIDWNPSLSNLGTRDVPVNVPDLECLGCHLHECKIGHMCMNNLTEERVLEACKKILSKEEIKI